MIDQRHICAHIVAALPRRARPIGPTAESWSLWSADPLCLPARNALTGSYLDEETDRGMLLSRTGGVVILTQVHGDAVVYVLAPGDVVPGALTRLVEHVAQATVAAVATDSDGFAAVCFCLRGSGSATFWQHVASRLAHKALGLHQIDPNVSEMPREEATLYGCADSVASPGARVEEVGALRGKMLVMAGAVYE